MTHRIPLSKVLTYAVLVFWAFVSIFPIYWVAATSLKAELAIMQGPFYIPFVDFTPTLNSWKFILFDYYENLRMRFFNSAVIGVVSTALTLLLGGMAVYGLTRFRLFLPWRGLNNRSILAAMLATRILPPVVLVLPVYMMAYYTNTLDMRFVLVFTYAAVNLPVALWLLQTVFGERATEQEEPARLDGASHMTIFFTIFVPMVAASAAAVGLLIFILCWNEYLFAVSSLAIKP